jgi:single-strand DNA-binding protein
MGNRFNAYLAGRVATEPTLGTTKDGKPWVRFRLAVDDRSPNADTGEWEKSQTIFHDVVAFGRLAERTVGTVHSGDAVIAHGEFRFRSYEGPGGMTHTGTQFVASRLGPDILLSDVTVHRGHGREAERDQSREVARETPSAAEPQAERAEGVPAAGGGASATAATAHTPSASPAIREVQAFGRVTDAPSPSL